MEKKIVNKCKKQQDIPIRPRYGIPAADNEEMASSYTEIPTALGEYVKEEQNVARQLEAYADEDSEDEQLENEKSCSPHQLTDSQNQFFQTDEENCPQMSSDSHDKQQQPFPILPQIDADVLNDIEIEAQYLSSSVDNLLENLSNLLQSISSITADSVEEQRKAVNLMTDNMDANIKCMYTIMAKTEEISKNMKPTEQLAQRIREIKTLVDTLESAL